MNIVLWVAQVLLVVMFGMAGFMKLTQPVEKLLPRMKWVDAFSPSTVKLLGALDLLGAIGVILPWLTGILPWLTPLAAVGLICIMVGAIVLHLRRGEANLIGINIVLFIVAAFVALGRFGLIGA